jgi:hypothetical protein
MDGYARLLARVTAAFAAGAAGFALAAGAILLTGGDFEGWGLLALFAAVPAAAMALFPFSARVFCFALGLIALAATWLIGSSGPHNPLILLPWIAFWFAAAAVLAELCMRASRRLIGPRPTQAWPDISPGPTDIVR